MAAELIQHQQSDTYGQIHPVETDEFIQAKLMEMEQEIEQLPDDRKVNLMMAKEKCPELLTDSFKLMFLRCEVFRAKDAAKRFARYWDVRRDICESDEKAFLPFTLDMNSSAFPEDDYAFSMGLNKLLPKKDPSGRAILFLDTSKQDHSRITVNSQARATAYTLMAALEDETTQQKGIVAVFWLGKERWDQPNREFISLLAYSVKGALPLRLSGVHICQPPAFFRLIIPFVKVIMGARLRRRIRFHTGSLASVQESLEPYGLTKDILPTELGGDVELDHDAWLKARRQAGK